MKQELGKWLMDVAKYVVTVLLLSNLFRGMDDWSLGGVLLIILGVLFIMFWGLYLVSMAESQEKKNTGNVIYSSSKKKGGRKWSIHWLLYGR